MTGLLGDRLFAQFDFKKTGYLDLDEFVIGLASFCRGTLDDKIHFLFNMYDTAHCNTVSKEELTTLLNQVPKYVLHPEMLYGFPPGGSPDLAMNGSRPVSPKSQGSGSGAVSTQHPALSGVPDLVVDVSTPTGGPMEEVLGMDGESDSDELEHVDFFTNHDVVEKAFEECDLNHEGRLSYEQFKMWVQRTPGIIEYLESIMPWAVRDETIKRHSQKDALPIYGMMKKGTTVNNLTGRMIRQPSNAGESPVPRPQSMQRSVSHGYEHRDSPVFGGDQSVTTAGGGTSIASSAYPKPSPLVMPKPMLARNNSVSHDYLRHRAPGSPMSLQSPSPPLPHHLENLVIEENVRALLTQVMFVCIITPGPH